MLSSPYLAPLLALVFGFGAGCASTSRIAPPDWERYKHGELAGFLAAPGEHIDNEVPEIAVRRVRGRLGSPVAGAQLESRLEQLRPNPTVRVSESDAYRTPDLAAVDVSTFVVELRGPGLSPQVRTIATRSGVFDFGPLPEGTYTLKATASGSSTVLGWWSRVRTVLVSNSAGAAAEVGVW
jgi:hypothetical protein